ncbi:ABC transporter ATP-binding protein [Microbacterium capsulatum]|uniref:ABC transporter ATP-binding protein n=1 Tax=Microbacterium capsulatum TaxID=3041921 RepID=A0ABU0XIK8_9MICO|nr:ABC transporter ATP-binding protein [Microbacterium sp. ASV81]MDQ4214977.1 ABC transporter ATP-binding protein [Microbacterium sp. ASV81]
MARTEAMLSLQDLSVKATKRDLTLVDGVSLSIGAGERMALVGESGSGKSLTCMSIINLLARGLAVSGGSIRWNGEDIAHASPARMRQLRGREISMIYQEPLTALNPILSIGTQLGEAARHVRATRADVLSMLDRVGFHQPERVLRQRPHELSGGMRQRAMIAMALLGKPRLLLADEPTTALDVTVQDQVLKLIYDISVETGTALLLVSHDLNVVRRIADRVAVMYTGRIVESGETERVLTAPRHPYTDALLQSAPSIEAKSSRLTAIPGRVPTPSEWTSGCRFAQRCAFATDACSVKPAFTEVDGQAAACWHTDRLLELKGVAS